MKTHMLLNKTINQLCMTRQWSISTSARSDRETESKRKRKNRDSEDNQMQVWKKLSTRTWESHRDSTSSSYPT